MSNNEALLIVGAIRRAAVSDIQQEVDAQWRALKSDPEIREYAESQGINLGEIDAIKESPFAVERRASGTGAGEAILIGVAINLATAAMTALAKKIWKTVLKPALNKGGRRIEDGDQ